MTITIPEITITGTLVMFVVMYGIIGFLIALCANLNPMCPGPGFVSSILMGIFWPLVFFAIFVIIPIQMLIENLNEKWDERQRKSRR